MSLLFCSLFLRGVYTSIFPTLLASKVKCVLKISVSFLSEDCAEHIFLPGFHIGNLSKRAVRLEISCIMFEHPVVPPKKENLRVDQVQPAMQ